MVVASNTLVSLAYELLDEQGELYDCAAKERPLCYVHGYEQLVPGLEKRLEGCKAGDRLELFLEADEAFGPYDDDGVFDIPRAHLGDDEEIIAGDEFVAEGEDGEPIPVTVLEVLDDTLVVDTNHPLAGQRVLFRVEVIDARPAAEDEIAKAKRRERVPWDHARRTDPSLVDRP